MGFLNRFRRDRLSLILLLVILALGIFIRLNDFSEVGYWNDDMSTIPTGLLAFHPSSSIGYPGLAGQGEPILGNLIIASGCMLSGEDFSKVSEIKPMFYPGREELIGTQLINAFPYCHIPMYLFGILLFLAISLLALNLLNKYSALFVISFYAFYPRLLQLSRWIHVDLMGYFFIVSGLLFLWLAYDSKKNKKEIFLFIISYTSFALAFAVKLPNGAYLLFATFILILKYKRELLQLIRKIGFKLDLDVFKKIDYNEELQPSRLIFISTFSFLFYILTFLIPLYLNPKNLIDIVNKYQSVYSDKSTLTLNKDVFESIFYFLLTLNIIDILLILFSLYLLVRLFRIRKNKQEKFIFHLTIFLILLLLSVETLVYPRIFLSFSFGLILLTSLAFSNKTYSLFNLFKLKNRKLIFLSLLLVYVAFSFTLALSSSPHFETKNPFLCRLTSQEDCNVGLERFVQKDLASYFKTTLKANETVLLGGITFYYLNQEQSLPNFYFEESFRQEVGRYPTMEEKVIYFKPYNKTIRYIILDPNLSKKIDLEPLLVELNKNYVPNKIIYSKKTEAAWIYDLQNLTKKENEI